MDYHVKETRTVSPYIKRHTKREIQDKKFLDEHENKGMSLKDLDFGSM